MKLGEAIRFAYQELAELIEHNPDSRMFNVQKFDPAIVAAPRPPGRQGYRDTFYASIAAAYVDALKREAPARFEGIAATFNRAWGSTYRTPYFRDLIAEARQRELLTRPPKGRPGGELTEKGQKAL